MNKQISTVIWDVDGTLYNNYEVQGLKQYYEQFIDEYLAEHLLNLTPEKRRNQYNNLKKKMKSSTITLATLGNETVEVVGKALDDYIPKQKYLKKDPKLIQLFKDLQHYNIKHYILRNGTKAKTLEILDWLGLAELNFPDCEFGPFQKVITVFDMLKTAKPDIKAFQYFMDEFGIDVQTSLSVGDRTKVDLVPAKKIGMQTVLVWADEVSQEEKQSLDYVFPTVYDVIKIFK